MQEQKKNYWNLIETNVDKKNIADHNFRFLHGIEMEYFLLNYDYEPINDHSLLEQLVDDFYFEFKKILEKNPEIKTKVKHFDVADQIILGGREDPGKNLKKVKTVYVNYDMGEGKSSSFIDIIGKDTNNPGGSITLELVTPPCQSLKELTWWVYNLQKIVFLLCNKLYLRILPLAFHPSLSDFCGEHHHIGIPNENIKLLAYSIIRLFLPLLSIITYTSFDRNQNVPLANNLFDTQIDDKIIRSFRLKNTTQIKPVPPLTKMNKDEFTGGARLDKNTIRLVDIFPFTSYGTIEVRIFDTQISVTRTIAIALLLQAICEFSVKFANSLNQETLMILNKIATRSFYENKRLELITAGFSSFQKPIQIYQCFKDQIINVCKCCENVKDCNKKGLPYLDCSFKAKDWVLHNLVSYLLFPKRFRYTGGKMYGGSKIYPDDLFKLMLFLLKPALKEINLTQHVALQVIDRTLEVKKEPSMFLLCLYKFYKGDLKQFFNRIRRIQERIFNADTIWGIYYDPFFNLAQEGNPLLKED